jgi:hypothetical protein
MDRIWTEKLDEWVWWGKVVAWQEREESQRELSSLARTRERHLSCLEVALE